MMKRKDGVRKTIGKEFSVRESEFISSDELRIDHVWTKHPKSGARRIHEIPCMLVGFQETRKGLNTTVGKTHRPVILTVNGDYRVVKLDNLKALSR